MRLLHDIHRIFGRFSAERVEASPKDDQQRLSSWPISCTKNWYLFQFELFTRCCLQFSTVYIKNNTFWFFKRPSIPLIWCYELENAL